ncbi:hypothetical protein CRENBAI_016315 [Crenichthys baileyi]|uniref:Uncharacterized protein n=1 Tax=Crenichthys baileyi TaxID=28760 RepID=A0AAV9RXN2_9TELE
MSDYESDDPAGSLQDLFLGPRPPAAAYARRSSRLASQLITPSPSSQLRKSGINPGSDQDASQLALVADILSHDSPPPPSMGKCRCKNSNPPAKTRRGCSSSTLASAMSLPGPSTAALASLLDPPAASSSSTPAVPASFISSMDLLQRSITSLTHHLMDFSAEHATSAVLPPSAPPNAQSVAQPAARPLPSAFTLANARPGSLLGSPYVPFMPTYHPDFAQKSFRVK